NVIVVGAGLVPAHDVVLSDDGSIVGASDHDVVPVNTGATTRVAPTLGHVIGTYESLVPIQPFNCFFVSYRFSTPDVGLWTLDWFYLTLNPAFPPTTHHPPLTTYCLSALPHFSFHRKRDILSVGSCSLKSISNEGGEHETRIIGNHACHTA
ncbi:hypothetical protein KAX14_04715, partial [Candidatus Bipolaricaulota bacterium]|nr:hypothetical protein [Candidatus Bipolaricaulota bacterium]